MILYRCFCLFGSTFVFSPPPFVFRYREKRRSCGAAQPPRHVSAQFPLLFCLPSAHFVSSFNPLFFSFVFLSLALTTSLVVGVSSPLFLPAVVLRCPRARCGVSPDCCSHPADSLLRAERGSSCKLLHQRASTSKMRFSVSLLVLCKTRFFFFSRLSLHRLCAASVLGRGRSTRAGQACTTAPKLFSLSASPLRVRGGADVRAVLGAIATPPLLTPSHLRADSCCALCVHAATSRKWCVRCRWQYRRHYVAAHVAQALFPSKAHRTRPLCLLAHHRVPRSRFSLFQLCS